MQGTGMIATIVIAAVFAVGQPASANEPGGVGATSASVSTAVGWLSEAVAARAGTWTVSTRYAMPGVDLPFEDEAVAVRTVSADGRVLEEQAAGTMLSVPYTEDVRLGYDEATGLYWMIWSDNTIVAPIEFHGDFDAATVTYTYEAVVADGDMGEVAMRIRWTLESPDRETVVHALGLAGGEMTEVMWAVYERQH